MEVVQRTLPSKDIIAGNGREGFKIVLKFKDTDEVSNNDEASAMDEEYG